VIWQGREANMEANKARYAQDTEARTLADIVAGADVFLGCSTAGVLSGEMVKTMADRPVILALANPEPEIRPEVAKAARPDCIVATGRSDYPNQVNNVLCFPYIFRGALDCGATRITDEMKLACVSAIADLAEAEANDAVAAAYAGQDLSFRSRLHHPEALRSAPDGGDRAGRRRRRRRIRRRRPPDRRHGRLPREAGEMIYHTGFFMKPVFAKAKANPRRVAYAEGATSACCARCRPWSTRAWRSRC
jgi:malate dehydrogenase (oxaloacetate-decarboxylating)(NADP+)